MRSQIKVKRVVSEFTSDNAGV